MLDRDQLTQRLVACSPNNRGVTRHPRSPIPRSSLLQKALSRQPINLNARTVSTHQNPLNQPPHSFPKAHSEPLTLRALISPPALSIDHPLKPTNARRKLCALKRHTAILPVVCPANHGTSVSAQKANWACLARTKARLLADNFPNSPSRTTPSWGNGAEEVDNSWWPDSSHRLTPSYDWFSKSTTISVSEFSIQTPTTRAGSVDIGRCLKGSR